MHSLAATALILACLQNATEPVAVLDDFESGDLVSRSGLAWIPLTDAQFGGASQTTVEAIRPGAGGSRGALRIEGHAVPGDGPIVVAGAWVALAPTGGPCDLSAFESLRFRIRGRADTLEVGVRAGRASPVNRMAAVVPGAEWSPVEIRLDALRSPATGSPEGAGWDFRDAWFLGFSTPPNVPASFAVDLDDLCLVPRAGVMVPPAIVSSDPTPYTMRIEPPRADTPGANWVPLAREAAGDGTWRRLPDATALWYDSASPRDTVRLRIDLDGAPSTDAIGINVAVDTNGDPADGSAWWGPNRAFRWDRLVTAYLFRAGPGWQGIVGVADSAGVARGDMGSVTRAGVSAAPDPGRRACVVTAPRSALGNGTRLRIVATVGSAMVPNDDIPDSGAADLVLPPAAPENTERESW